MKNLFRLFGVLTIFLVPLTSSGQSIQLADSLFQQGKDYDESGNEKQSEFYYREAYNIYRDFRDTANWLKAGKEYASAMMWLSKEDQAIELYKKLLDVDHSANDAYNRGDLYNSMALAYKRMGNIEQAMQYYQESMPLARESGDSLLIGTVNGNIGGIYATRGHISKALEFEQRALSYYRGLDNKRFIAISLGNIGGFYRELSLYDKALEYYNQSLEIRKSLGDINQLASIYNSIAIAQRNLGNYDQALVAYEKSLGLSRQAGTVDLTADVLNNLGVLYKNLGEYDRALDYYQQSLAMKGEVGDPMSVATTAKNMGNLLWEQEKTEEAKRYYTNALELRRQVGNPYEIASSLGPMVKVELSEENYQQALSYAGELEAIGDSTNSYDLLENAVSWKGHIESNRENYKTALNQYKKAHAYSQYLTKDDQLVPLKNLAQTYHQLGSDSAVIYGQRAIDIIEENRTNAGAISDLKAGYFQRHSDFYTEVASWVLTYHQDTRRAFRLVEMAKARSLSDDLAQASQNIVGQLPEDVRVERSEKRRDIQSLYSELEGTTNPERRAQIEEEIRMAELSFAAYENNLHSEYPAFKNLESPESIGLKRAQSLTDQGTAVLEYAVADNQLMMFLISQNEVRVEQLSLSEGESIDNQLTTWVADFKDAILKNASRMELRKQSRKLYDALIKPFEESLSNYENLIIVPDGPLAYLPFEALSRGDQYLIENYHIKYEPSLTSLTLINETESLDRKQLLAVAGSQFSEETMGDRRKNTLSALPSTVIEVDSIASHFQSVATLKEEQVSEAAFKNMVRENSYQYIHLATHGIIDEQKPSRSGLALSAGGEITASSKEDGMLRSSEIFGLNLNSEMVVLSACNTGLGKVVKGEGMLGMQRSFFYAGTSTVVVSLWNVYDRSTASFMNEFYKALKDIPSQESWSGSFLRWIGWDESIPFGRRAMAMREAKLQMIKHPLFNHPVYWAPFIVVGR